MCNSFFNADNLKTWEENPKNRLYEDLLPANIYWFKTILFDYDNRDRKYVMHNMKTIIKPEIEPASLNISKSKLSLLG